MVKPQSHMLAQFEQVIQKIDQDLQNGAEPIAAFDADGTLWDTDIGENFFHYQINNNLLPNLPSDPWAHYEAMHEKDSPGAFLWLAQISSGFSIDDVRKWSEDSYKKQSPIPFFEITKKIIQHLVEKNVSVYIVTASVQWAVEPAAKDFKIPATNILGIVTKIENGLVTAQPGAAVSWREGKVTRLLEATGGKKPFLAAGNTMGDLSLLESATHVKLANCAAKPDSRIYETERELVGLAKERSWYCFDYTDSKN